ELAGLAQELTGERPVARVQPLGVRHDVAAHELGGGLAELLLLGGQVLPREHVAGPDVRGEKPSHRGRSRLLRQGAAWGCCLRTRVIYQRARKGGGDSGRGGPRARGSRVLGRDIPDFLRSRLWEGVPARPTQTPPVNALSAGVWAAIDAAV